MKPFNYEGLMAPTFAPFKNDGSLNLEVVPTYAKYLKKSGIRGAWVNGTAGEGMSMTVSERKQLAEAWMKCRDDIPTVIIQCGAGCIKDTCELAAHAESLGAEGVGLFPNLFDRPATPDDLVDYMEEVSKSCPNTPLFYYHFPTKTNVKFSMSEFLTKGIKRIPTLSGLKFTDMDVQGEGRKMMQVQGRKVTLFNGFDEMLSEAFSIGFRCAIGGTYTAAPELGSQIFALMKEGKVEEAKKVQQSLIDFAGIMFKQTNGLSVASLKAASTVRSGIDFGPTRFPVKAYTPEMMQRLREDCIKAGMSVH